MKLTFLELFKKDENILYGLILVILCELFISVICYRFKFEKFLSWKNSVQLYIFVFCYLDGHF